MTDPTNTHDLGDLGIAGRRLSRRDLLKGASFVGAAAVFSPLLAACGSGTTSSGSSASAVASPIKGGALRLGVIGGSSKDTADGQLAMNGPDNLRSRQLWDTLMVRDHEFKLQNGLAEEVSSNADGTVWTIRVRDGVTFHNGKTLGADDVIFTFQTILDPDFPNEADTVLSSVDPKQLKKVDERTVQVTLKQANAIFDDTLAFSKVTIKPVGYDPKNPVGTGPFMYKTFIPGNRSLFPAFADYWGTGPYVDSVELIDFADETAMVNALLGGSIDAASDVPAAQIAQIEAGGFELLEQETARWNYIFWNLDVKPFQDERVRQAMRLIMDRQQMIDQALSGYATLGNDMWSRYDPAYPTDVPQRVQDIEQAKSLLAQAGVPDLSFTFYTSDVAYGAVEAAQVFAEQAKAAGVTIKVVKEDLSVYWGDKYLTYPNGSGWYSARNYLSQARLCQDWNEPHWDDKQWNALIDQAYGTVDATKRSAIIQEAYAIDYDIGPWDVWSWAKGIDAHVKKVAGFVPDASGIPFNAGYVNEVWFAS